MEFGDSNGYNPLDKQNLGISVRDALLRQPVNPMSSLLLSGQQQKDFKFSGSGIYALYYIGEFPIYQPVAEENRAGKFASPIYVGKADPKGSRKGGLITSAKPSSSLFTRLGQHAAAIGSASNLNLEDFYFRYLLVDDIWIPLGETYVIQRYRPVWNYVVAGFGNKTPGKRRKGQRTSLWDTLHPGRGFVTELNLPPNPKTAEQIADEVKAFFALTPDVKAQLPVRDEGDSDNE